MPKEEFGFGGIVFHPSGGGSALDGSSVSSQTAPKEYYVYGHFDATGAMFYLGKGLGRRAWKGGDRHLLWDRYVQKNLGGKFEVRILADRLRNEDAEMLESALMKEKPEGLVNWVNWGRKDDFAATDRFHKLRNANRERAQSAFALLEENPELAVKHCAVCVGRIADYAYTVHQSGLVGQLMRELHEESGWEGDFEVFEFLIRTLLKIKRPDEAYAASEAYFGKYRMELRLVKAQKLRERIAKAVAKKVGA